MIKKVILLLFAGSINLYSQTVLDVPLVIQSEDQWCWAATSTSVLNYYGLKQLKQCEVAEYARTVITWHNFGKTDCCVNTKDGCNYWNYNWGAKGSIEDILMNFGKIAEKNVNSSLSFATIVDEIKNKRPFIIRWGWVSGGGHFIVGKGYNEDGGKQNVNYMNPWPGEGEKVSTYTWLKSDGNHTWTHTNQLTTSPNVTAVNNFDMAKNITVYPNPAENLINIAGIDSRYINNIQLIDITGRVVLTIKNTSINLNDFNIGAGAYLVKINANDFVHQQKIIVQ